MLEMLGNGTLVLTTTAILLGTAVGAMPSAVSQTIV